MGLFDHDEVHLLKELVEEFRETKFYLRELFHHLFTAQSALLKFKVQGDMMADLTVHISDKPGTAVFTEWTGLAGTGTKVPPVGAVTFASDHPEFATVDANTGALVYVAAGAATISASDAGNSLSASAVLTVVADVAVSATLDLVPAA